MVDPYSCVRMHAPKGLGLPRVGVLKLLAFGYCANCMLEKDWRYRMRGMLAT